MSSLAALGLKFHPFRPSVPIEALHRTPQAELFLGRVERSVGDGGLALLCGEPGTGKSAVLRMLHDRLRTRTDLVVATIAHPQSRPADFYRELGDAFGLAMRPNNRWESFKGLRARWGEHIAKTCMRPVVLIDEAQEMLPQVLAELRLLSSKDFDAEALLCVVFAGDTRFLDKLDTKELAPLRSRVRRRLLLEHASHDTLKDCLEHLLEAAGNVAFMSESLKHALVDHAAGNYRVLMQMGDELLLLALDQRLTSLDEHHYTQAFGAPKQRSPSRRRASS